MDKIGKNQEIYMLTAIIVSLWLIDEIVK